MIFGFAKEFAEQRVGKAFGYTPLMSRGLRPQIHGGIYHVMNRGNRKAIIFDDARDRRRFLKGFVKALDDHGVELLGGTEMTTHFHAVVHTPHANISAFMQQFEGEFAQYINWRHKRVGHLFQGTFRGVVIENDIHLFTALWYVLANPRQAGLVARHEDWRWSTYAATVGLRPTPHYLKRAWLETLFPAASFEASQRMFRHCMEKDEPVIAYLMAVDPTIDVAIRSYVSERIRQMSAPASYRELFRPPLDQLFWLGQPRLERNRMIRTARVNYGYTLAEIARAAALDPSTVGKIFQTMRSEPEQPARDFFSTTNDDQMPDSGSEPDS